MAANLKRRRDVIAHLDLALESGDARKVVRAFRDAARAEGSAGAVRRLRMTQADLSARFAVRGGPELGIVLKFVRALGRRLVVVTE